MTNADAQTGKQRGATVGGLTGAAIGAAIGDNNNEAGAGAAIGGLIGAFAGGVLGDANDKDYAIRKQQQYYHAQQQQIARIQSAVSMADIVSMRRSGLSDNVIVNQVRSRGFTHKLTVQDILALHQQGISEQLITYLQNAPIGEVQRVQTVPQPAPVVVHQPPVIQRVITPAPVIYQKRVVSPYYRRGYKPSRSGYGSPRGGSPSRSGIHIRF